MPFVIAKLGDKSLDKGDRRTALELYRQSWNVARAIDRQGGFEQVRPALASTLMNKLPVFSDIRTIPFRNNPAAVEVKGVEFDRGLIIEFAVPSGVVLQPLPTGKIDFKQTGGSGSLIYLGYNLREVTPTMPGAPSRIYSLFFCPNEAGRAEYMIEFRLGDGSKISVPVSIEVAPAIPPA